MKVSIDAQIAWWEGLIEKMVGPYFVVVSLTWDAQPKKTDVEHNQNLKLFDEFMLVSHRLINNS